MDDLPYGGASRNNPAGNRRFAALTPAEGEIVEAIAARIFPATSTPGATEAGAVFYIDRLLREAYPKLLSSYQTGCAAMERHARMKFKQSFLALSPPQQDAVLTDFDRGEVRSYPKAKRFFSLVRRHTMEGVLGEPSYGGNRDMIGWRLVGFPGQQFGYADAYINRVIDLEPVAIDGAYPRPEALDDRKR
jgi:gluconate 2-dehydrogenase gamma chain